MLTPIFSNILAILVNLVIAILFVVLLVRTSHFLFGVNLKEQIQNGNKAVAIFTLGLMIMVGMVIGLFKV